MFLNELLIWERYSVVAWKIQIVKFPQAFNSPDCSNILGMIIAGNGISSRKHIQKKHREDELVYFRRKIYI